MVLMYVMDVTTKARNQDSLVFTKHWAECNNNREDFGWKINLKNYFSVRRKRLDSNIE